MVRIYSFFTVNQQFLSLYFVHFHILVTQLTVTFTCTKDGIFVSNPVNPPRWCWTKQNAAPVFPSSLSPPADCWHIRADLLHLIQWKHNGCFLWESKHQWTRAMCFSSQPLQNVWIEIPVKDGVFDLRNILTISAKLQNHQISAN